MLDHDIKVSPLKGKSKQEPRWNMEWWDFYPLVEGPKRPVVWASSSTIFTAHSVQPLVTARLLPSSQRFTLPPPTAIFSSPQSYEPPTVISVSPGSHWLFAYFPGVASPGRGCIWKRSDQLDSWEVQPVQDKEGHDISTFPMTAGVVTAEWLGTDRQWVTDENGLSTRLPPRGPRIPVVKPSLLLVTEDHQLHFWYLRAFTNVFRTMKCPLLQPTLVAENQPPVAQVPPSGPGGVRVCVGASIALIHNENAILVAMRSHLHPTPSARLSSFNPMDLSLSLDVAQSFDSDAVSSPDWEAWGEEATIELCEIQMGFDGATITILSNPLPPIQHSSGPKLTNLAFVCVPPPIANVDQANTAKATGDSLESGRTYLGASFLDFSDYSSLPRSELVLYSLSRNLSVSNTSHTAWIISHQSSRTFQSGVLAFTAPSLPCSYKNRLYAGIYDATSTAPPATSHTRELPVGKISVLRLSDLSDDDEWEASSIMMSKGGFGREVPLNVAISPNNMLLSTVSSPMSTNRTSVHPLPRRHPKTDLFSGEVTKSTDLPFALVSSIHAHNTTADITHTLLGLGGAAGHVVDTLYTVLSLCNSNLQGKPEICTWEVIGIAVEMYGSLLREARTEDDKKLLNDRMQTARSLCSIAACNTAFEDCQEGESYDLDAVWQLVGMSQWAIGFTENLLKQCLLVNPTSTPDSTNSQVDGEDLFGSTPTSPAFDGLSPSLNTPMLLHLAHPFALNNLFNVLTHVKGLCKFMTALSARAEGAHIAKDILVDVVECAGFDIDVICSFLAKCVQDSKSISGDETWKSLALCQPTPALGISLRKTIQKLSDGSIIDKPRLLIKSSDLVDANSKTPIDHYIKERSRDAVSMGLLAQRGAISICTRCGGKSEVGSNSIVAGHTSLRWRAWERVWASRCVCGGLWTH